MAKREMKTQNVEETIVEQTVIEEAIVEEPAPVVEEKKVEKAEKVIVPIGIVTGCDRLNIRKAPKKDGDIIAVVDAKAELNIDTKKSTDEWYRVRTSSNVWGYCMKKFVKIK